MNCTRQHPGTKALRGHNGARSYCLGNLLCMIQSLRHRNATFSMLPARPEAALVTFLRLLCMLFSRSFSHLSSLISQADRAYVLVRLCVYQAGSKYTFPILADLPWTAVKQPSEDPSQHLRSTSAASLEGRHSWAGALHWLSVGVGLDGHDGHSGPSITALPTAICISLGRPETHTDLTTVINHKAQIYLPT